MQNQNDEKSMAIMAVAFIATIGLILFAFIFAILAFISLLLTGVCLAAWEKEVRIGSWVLTPDEAHLFVYRGLAGAVLVPLFALFVQGVYGVRINPDFWLYFVLGGYALGSLGIELMMQSNEEASQGAVEVMPPPLPSTTAKPRIMPPQPDAPPFRFARWDDEEELP